MTGRVVRHPSAFQDLDDVADFLQRQSGPQRAVRFLQEADATARRLASMPGTGALYEPDNPVYAGLRYASVSRFKSYLIFDRPIAGGIEVWRVLHGARDLQGILAHKFEDATEDGEEPTEDGRE